jgi:hypothetical protein
MVQRLAKSGLSLIFLFGPFHALLSYSVRKESVPRSEIPENRVLLTQLPQLHRLAIKLLQVC